MARIIKAFLVLTHSVVSTTLAFMMRRSQKGQVYRQFARTCTTSFLSHGLGDENQVGASIESDVAVTKKDETVDDEVDVVIVGAGIGGLSAGGILNTLYGKKVAVFESHYLPGGCAHAFDRKASNGSVFTFDSGPTILLG